MIRNHPTDPVLHLLAHPFVDDAPVVHVRALNPNLAGKIEAKEQETYTLPLTPVDKAGYVEYPEYIFRIVDALKKSNPSLEEYNILGVKGFLLGMPEERMRILLQSITRDWADADEVLAQFMEWLKT